MHQGWFIFSSSVVVKAKEDWGSPASRSKDKGLSARIRWDQKIKMKNGDEGRWKIVKWKDGESNNKNEKRRSLQYVWKMEMKGYDFD